MSALLIRRDGPEIITQSLSAVKQPSINSTRSKELDPTQQHSHLHHSSILFHLVKIKADKSIKRNHCTSSIFELFSFILEALLFTKGAYTHCLDVSIFFFFFHFG